MIPGFVLSLACFSANVFYFGAGGERVPTQNFIHCIECIEN